MDELPEHVDDAIRLIKASVSLFGFEGVCLSFNGGKDSTLLLHLVMQAFPKDYRRITFVYFKQHDEFPEVQAFIDKCNTKYQLSLQHLGASYRTALEDLLQQTPIKAFLMGTRRGDPRAESLSAFSLSDRGWPTFMRVHPVLEWTYKQVWDYLQGKPYCVLYDKGYTSIGHMHNTRPNPRLERSDGTYRPAHELQDGSLERCGRVSTSPQPQPPSQQEQRGPQEQTRQQSQSLPLLQHEGETQATDQKLQGNGTGLGAS